MNEMENDKLNKTEDMGIDIKKGFLKKSFFFVLVLLLMSGSFFAGIYSISKNTTIEEIAKEKTVFVGQVLGKYNKTDDGLLTQDVDFDLFWEVWDQLEKKYVDQGEINEKKLFYGALKGLTSAVGDPYTVFMDPVISKSFQDDLAGTFEGIGAEIGIKNDILTIVAPLPDMPAEKSGLLAGDQVFAINGETTMGISIDEAVNKIRGEKDTPVTLTIYREDFEVPKEIEIIRGKILVSSVRTTLRDDNIFVIKVTNFNEDTKQKFDIAIADIIKAEPLGIIIDLRNNPGGFLDTAIEMSSEWVEDGTVVIEKFSEDRVNPYLARGRARLKDYNTVVLVNQGSASASEIVAGALQDTNEAKLVGMQTFGKGSVQTLETLSDGSSLKITVAKWLTPKGRSINDEGIAPDIQVDLTLEDYNNNTDPQVEKAVEILFDYEKFQDIFATSTEEIIEE
ncbi:MAG: S41 family peptidase [Patescibacteria group bacterium]|jgi:carboxyl-terminal processing protease|nr:S41 family peptidase [Patescibacteria group bacterium]